MLFPPPYTYNDPRLLYNEPCFFYDGGFDDVCLLNKFSVKRGGKSSGISGGKRKKKELEEEEKKEYLNIFIECELNKINNKPVKKNKKPTVFRFVGENEKIDVSINNVKVSLSKPVIKGEYLNLMKKIFVSSSFDGIKEEQGIEALKKINANVKVVQVEPYEKIKVTSTLVNVKQRKDK